MKKMKFGLPITLFVALIYFGSLQSPLLAALMIGLIFLTEENDTAKKAALQASVVLGAVWALRGIYQLVNEVIILLNQFVGNGYLHMPYGLSSLMDLICTGVPFALGVMAFLGKMDVLDVEKSFAGKERAVSGKAKSEDATQSLEKGGVK